MTLDLAPALAIANGDAQTKVIAIPPAKLDHRADAVHVALETVDRPRTRRREHEIVQQHGVEQTTAELETDDSTVAGRTRKREIYVIARILAGGAGEDRAVGDERVAVRSRERRANIPVGAIARRRRRGEVADDQGPTMLVRNHLPARIVADLEQLEVIDVVCLEGLIANVQGDDAGAVGAGVEEVDISRLEQRRNPSCEDFGLQCGLAGAIGIYGRAGAKDGHGGRDVDSEGERHRHRRHEHARGPVHVALESFESDDAVEGNRVERDGLIKDADATAAAAPGEGMPLDADAVVVDDGGSVSQ